MGYAWSKKYKVLNISVVTLLGESQADYWELSSYLIQIAAFYVYTLEVGIYACFMTSSQLSCSYFWCLPLFHSKTNDGEWGWGGNNH